jgi:hypothetical protein
MKKNPTTFDELLGLWDTPKELSLALGTLYVTAQLMKRRRSVGVDHWPRLIEAAAAKGVILTSDDLLAMREKRRAAA